MDRLSAVESALDTLLQHDLKHLNVEQMTAEALELMHTWMMTKEAEVAELKTRISVLEQGIRLDG